MDTSNVRHPLGRIALIGDTSTHGLAEAEVETALSQNYNIYIHSYFKYEHLILYQYFVL